ncbi:MAG: sigma-70 family RNA polymerase sigma factor [Candidatus Omnitrophota bacterium]|nr:MAG: sigma-70 family RNA polymerase sigma factor [Candidatus Omnitrophota bacterium]
MDFYVLLKRIGPTLKMITYKLSWRYSFLDQDDLYQEAAIHLWSDFRARKLDDKTDSYILQGCYFHLKNYLRRSENRSCAINIDSFLNDDSQGSQVYENTLLADYRFKEEVEKLNSKLLVETIFNNGLTNREKEVLWLCLEDLKTREIGKRLNISHVSVVKIMSKIREKCRKHLEG